MKVVWGKFGTGVDLIVCAISSYWWVKNVKRKQIKKNGYVHK